MSCMRRDHSIPIGDTFGRLKILRNAEKIGKTKVICLCTCGSETTVLLASLKSGNTLSCGCALRESRVKHGMHDTPEYTAWAAMIQRCTNPNSAEWKNYGGRSISVCAEWRESFSKFFDFVGKRPSKKHSIDRHPDKNGNYEPGNIRWATAKQQSRNTRRNIILDDGRLLADAAESAGISIINARNRRALGWSDGELLIPVKTRGKYRTRKCI
jgi:hypothetical protein